MLNVLHLSQVLGLSVTEYRGYDNVGTAWSGLSHTSWGGDRWVRGSGGMAISRDSRSSGDGTRCGTA
jgi:hypothetical protein